MSKKAAATKKMGKITATIAKDIVPPKDELDKMKERTVKKIASKVKKDSKDLLKQVAEEAATKARNKIEQELAPKLDAQVTPIEPIEVKPDPVLEELRVKLAVPGSSTVSYNDHLCCANEPVVFKSMEDLEMYSLQIYGMGLVSGFALYYMGSKLWKWLNASSSNILVEEIVADV